jgi:hypothetical protein
MPGTLLRFIEHSVSLGEGPKLANDFNHIEVLGICYGPDQDVVWGKCGKVFEVVHDHETLGFEELMKMLFASDEIGFVCEQFVRVDC